MEKSLYFIALLPPSSLSEKVDFLRNKLGETFGCKAALKSPPHITLVPPIHMTEVEAEELKQKISKTLEDYRGFDVRIGDISWFSDRTVFFEVVTHIKALRSLKNDLLGDLDPRFSGLLNRRFHPHMTLANRDIEASQKEAIMKAILEEKQKLETIREASHRYDMIVFFKHNTKNWQEFKSYQLIK